MITEKDDLLNDFKDSTKTNQKHEMDLKVYVKVESIKSNQARESIHFLKEFIKQRNKNSNIW